MQKQVAGQIWVIPTSVLSQTVLSCSFLQELPGIFYKYFSKLNTKMWNCFGMGCAFSTSWDTAQCSRVIFPTHLPTGTTSASPHSHRHWVLSDFSTVWPGWWVWGLISYSLFNLQLPERWGILPNVYCPGCLHPALPIHTCCPFSTGLFIISSLIYRGSLCILGDSLNLWSCSFLICEWEC